MEKDELKLLLNREQIRRRVKELAAEISRDYRGREILLICVLKGAFVFLSDLMRHIDSPVQVDFVGLASYGSEMVSSGQVRVTRESTIPVKGKDVIIEDLDLSRFVAYWTKNPAARWNSRRITWASISRISSLWATGST